MPRCRRSRYEGGDGEAAMDQPRTETGEGAGEARDKTPRTERGRRTLRKLLDAAAVEFGERGFHEASISAITRRAGTALGSFYTYFDSKEEIFQALVRSEEHTSELQSLMRLSYAVFCLQYKNTPVNRQTMMSN